MELQTNLYQLPYLLSSKYPSTEKMSESNTFKKDVIVDSWKKIILEGNGFEVDEIHEGLKTYLKDKCITKKIGNYATFCRKWCNEVLPHLAITDENHIERIYAVLSFIGKEYLEADTWGVRPDHDYLGQLESYKTLALPSSFSETMSYISNLCSALFYGNFELPWWIPATLTTFSRYRTARQCLVGTESVASTLRERHQGLTDTINEKFNAFKDIQAEAAKSFSENNVVKRDNIKSIQDIKKLSSERLTSLILKVTMAVSIFIAVALISVELTPILIPILALPGAIYNTGHWHGTLPAMGAMAIGTFVKGYIGYMGVTLSFAGMYLALAVGSITPAGFILLGITSLTLLVGCVVCSFGYDEMLHVRAYTRFFSEAPLDLPWIANDPMTTVGVPLTKGLDWTLNKILWLVDGNGSAVKPVIATS